MARGREPFALAVFFCDSTRAARVLHICIRSPNRAQNKEKGHCKLWRLLYKLQSGPLLADAMKASERTARLNDMSPL